MVCSPKIYPSASQLYRETHRDSSGKTWSMYTNTLRFLRSGSPRYASLRQQAACFKKKYADRSPAPDSLLTIVWYKNADILTKIVRTSLRSDIAAEGLFIYIQTKRNISFQKRDSLQKILHRFICLTESSRLLYC